MADKRYNIRHYQDIIDEIPLPTTHSCTVTDKKSHNVGHGRATTSEKAEDRAWQELKEKQGRC